VIDFKFNNAGQWLKSKLVGNMFARAKNGLSQNTKFGVTFYQDLAKRIESRSENIPQYLSSKQVYGCSTPT